MRERDKQVKVQATNQYKLDKLSLIPQNQHGRGRREVVMSANSIPAMVHILMRTLMMKF